MRLAWADAGYTGKLAARAAAMKMTLQIVSKTRPARLRSSAPVANSLLASRQRRPAQYRWRCIVFLGCQPPEGLSQFPVNWHPFCNRQDDVRGLGSRSLSTS